MSEELRKLIAGNVLALLKHERPFGPRESSGVARLIGKGVAQGNAQRILDFSASYGIDKISDVAGKLGVHPWQLLVPGLDPGDLPAAVRHGDVTPWPFRSLPQDRYEALTEREQGMVEFAARAEMERIERDRPRQPTSVSQADAGASSATDTARAIGGSPMLAKPLKGRAAPLPPAPAEAPAAEPRTPARPPARKRTSKGREGS